MRIPTRRGDRVLVRAAHALVLVPARFRLDAVACVDECGAVGRADRRWQMPAPRPRRGLQFRINELYVAELALKPRCEMSDEGNSRLEVLNSITTRTTIEVVNNILILCLNILRKSVTVF